MECKYSLSILYLSSLKYSFMSKYHESDNTKMLVYLLMSIFHLGFLFIFRMIPNSKMAAEVLKLNLSEN